MSYVRAREMTYARARGEAPERNRLCSEPQYPARAAARAIIRDSDILSGTPYSLRTGIRLRNTAQYAARRANSRRALPMAF